MAIVDEINRIKLNIANAYNECELKKAVMPELKNSNNLSNTIKSIKGGATDEELTALSEANTRLEDGLGVYMLEPPATKELVYTLSDTGDYYIVGTGSGDGNGLNADWQGGEVNIPSRHDGLPVKTISTYAFNNIKNISKVYIADGITTIGKDAFYGNTMIECRLPETLTSLASRAFGYCNALTSITIPNSVTSIKDQVFAYCGALTNVVIGSGVKTIGLYGFGFCDKLTNVTFNGTIEQWKAVEKQFLNFGSPLKVVHCSDGDAPVN